jgi:hypothetical protein
MQRVMPTHADSWQQFPDVSHTAAASTAVADPATAATDCDNQGTFFRLSNTSNSSCCMLRSCLKLQRSMCDCGLPSVLSHS